ncbi:head protein [Helicobacter enhydrae]|uniref:Head protein n=1 Tax=Helicobacter enhydrae TaxID=222136 RepID=A0A1B1U6Z4_9HELI|nr:Mu-like prophage major head subunit gpT family protein [Helicobacter enhydrae]ANV98564.1 head protein [Helicobacter enhydrae]
MPNKLDASFMENVSKGFSKVFNESLVKQNDDYKKISLEVLSNTIVTDYAWIADLPSMKEWVGERTLKELSAHNYTIKKKDWEATIKIHRDNLIYDNLGIVKPQIQSLAESVSMHYNQLIFKLLEDNGDCFDGKKFFATDHAVGSQSFGNKGTKVLSAESFLEARKEMRSLVNSHGTPLGIRPNLLVVPPELEATALKILKAQTIEGSSNITYGMCELLVCDHLSNDKAWYLFDTSRSVKPFILQVNKKPEFVALDKPNSDRNFMSKEILYGVDTEDNAGYGMWQLAYKSDGSEQ